MLPPELWDRLERFRVEEHLSSVAEAMRVLLWHTLGDQPEPKQKDSSDQKQVTRRGE
jgi:hypothetical protein